MTSAHRRPLCATCQRPQRSCLCGWVRACDNRVALLIVQHPLEVSQAKGSARLLQLSLSRCDTVIGEACEPALLDALQVLQADDDSALLYPADASSTPWTAATPPRRLVLLDGTWRKSRKLLHLNPALRALPRVSLAASPVSRYGRLRKAPRPGQLATLEAACLALQQLEGRSQPYAALLEAFDGWVAQLTALAPRPRTSA